MAERKDFLEESAESASKSQRRREALELKALASRLIGLTPAQRAAVPLPGDLAAAIDEARQIRSNVARKRQMQYVAKLLRRGDPSPILDALEAQDREARGLTAAHHRVEAWRDHLLETGDRALGALLDQRRDLDAQALRQLLRNARRERDRQQPPAAARSLFRALREADSSEALPPLPRA